MDRLVKRRWRVGVEEGVKRGWRVVRVFMHVDFISWDGSEVGWRRDRVYWAVRIFRWEV